MEKRHDPRRQFENFNRERVGNKAYELGYDDALRGRLHEPPQRVKNAGEAATYTEGFNDARK
jgi:hypothetical protein